MAADIFYTLRAAIERAKSEGAIEPGDKAPVVVTHMEAWLAEINRLQACASNTKQVFVVALHFGCEGHTAPFQAFLSQTEADAARKLFDGGGHSDANFYAVPVWPEPAVRWMDQKPIGREEP